jgi:hypothetical protein
MSKKVKKDDIKLTKKEIVNEVMNKEQEAV